MIFGPSGRDHDSPNQLLHFGEDNKILSKIQEKSRIHFRKILFVEISKFEKSNVLQQLERPEPKNTEDLSKKSRAY